MKQHKISSPKALANLPKSLRKKIVSSVHVDFNSLVNGDFCWVWTKCITVDGYSKIKINNRSLLAHRVAFVLWNGPIDEGITVHHVCLNTKCVNPRHLVLMTNSENIIEGNKRYGARGCFKKNEYEIPI